MEALPKTFKEYFEQISETKFLLSDTKKIRNKAILSFVTVTVLLITGFIIANGLLSMNTFLKRIMFTFAFCGLVYIAHLFVKRLFPAAMSFSNQNGCVIGCLGFAVHLIKKCGIYALLAAFAYWFLMLILDELFGIYYLFHNNSLATVNIVIVICAIVALIKYFIIIYRLITSIAYCKVLKEREQILEEYYEKNSLDLINETTPDE